MLLTVTTPQQHKHNDTHTAAQAHSSAPTQRPHITAPITVRVRLLRPSQSTKLRVVAMVCSVLVASVLVALVLLLATAGALVLLLATAVVWDGLQA